MQTITDKVLTLTSEMLLQKIEEQLKKLQQEKEQLVREHDTKKSEKLDTELYNYAKDLFNNIDKLWDIKDYKVCFELIYLNGATQTKIR